MIPYVFRPTTADFRKWCKGYASYAFDYVKTYEHYPSIATKENYEFARRICRQYKVLVASLSNNERQIFENTIMSGKAIHFSVKEERIAFNNIFENWKEICFPERKYRIKTITKEQVGELLTGYRKREGYTREHVADIVGISVNTLKSYESGERMIRLDVAYQLAQLYRISLNDIEL